MQNKSILLVEDNLDDEFLMLRSLRKLQIQHVTVVHEGAEAVDYLFGKGDYSGRDTATRPDMILLDLRLPLVDGLEFLEIIRSDRKTRELPVIVISSSRQERELAECVRLGVNTFLSKPVDTKDLARALQEAVSH